MTVPLAQQRMLAAVASGGISNDTIRKLVLKLIRLNNLKGSCLDFGAGRGHLALSLQVTKGIEKVTAIDLLSRPLELPESIDWYTQDLNEEVALQECFDVVVCSEVIEHLENPRAVLRTIKRLLKPGGSLVLTTPNQESIRSLLGLIVRGHFTHFSDKCYPAHITALLRKDLVRICKETGFELPSFYYTNEGSIPHLTATTWQRISLGLLRGRLFSDNLVMLARKADPKGENMEFGQRNAESCTPDCSAILPGR